MTAGSPAKRKLGGIGNTFPISNLQSMSKSDKPIYGIQWLDIFKSRPDLNPPGYDQLIQQIRKEQTNVQEDRQSLS
jgi:hypothetical protein